MVNLAFVEQLINSMDESLELLEEAVLKNKKDDIKKLRVFIFDLHVKISEEIKGKHV
jgi:ABC-type Fe3+-hydroxamate transport system substrate-binding protein